jgi:ATP-dependent DNA ligase
LVVKNLLSFDRRARAVCIKHDGFRIIARKKGAQVRLYSRPGNDLTRRFPLIVETLARLRSRSCFIDGEAVACNNNVVACLPSGTANRAGGLTIDRSARRRYRL